MRRQPDSSRWSPEKLEARRWEMTHCHRCGAEKPPVGFLCDRCHELAVEESRAQGLYDTPYNAHRDRHGELPDYDAANLAIAKMELRRGVPIQDMHPAVRQAARVLRRMGRGGNRPAE